jgi:hypothetical protein
MTRQVGFASSVVVMGSSIVVLLPRLAHNCPEGRDEDHWHMARELVAIEDNYALALKPVKQTAAIGPLANRSSL